MLTSLLSFPVLYLETLPEALTTHVPFAGLSLSEYTQRTATKRWSVGNEGRGRNGIHFMCKQVSPKKSVFYKSLLSIGNCLILVRICGILGKGGMESDATIYIGSEGCYDWPIPTPNTAWVWRRHKNGSRNHRLKIIFLGRMDYDLKFILYARVRS